MQACVSWGAGILPGKPAIRTHAVQALRPCTQAWRQGRTGYPLVDAGLRELWSTGWMHNRSRVVCASFLVKNLLLPWQWGLKHYWDAQLDADLESDALGWQYVSGCLAGAQAVGQAGVRSFGPGCPACCRPSLQLCTRHSLLWGWWWWWCVCVCLRFSKRRHVAST